MKTEINEKLEKMMELIEIAMREEGYKTLRMSEKNSPISTTEYDALILRNSEGQEFRIGFDESNEPRKMANGERDFNNWVSTNYITEVEEKKFFDFSDGFPYNAMICANTEEKAIKCYVDEVCELEDDSIRPKELSSDNAKKRYVDIAKNEDGKQKAIKEFNLYTSYDQPTVILIDGGLA